MWVPIVYIYSRPIDQTMREVNLLVYIGWNRAVSSVCDHDGVVFLVSLQEACQILHLERIGMQRALCSSNASHASSAGSGSGLVRVSFTSGFSRRDILSIINPFSKGAKTISPFPASGWGFLRTATVTLAVGFSSTKVFSRPRLFVMGEFDASLMAANVDGMRPSSRVAGILTPTNVYVNTVEIKAMKITLAS